MLRGGDCHVALTAQSAINATRRRLQAAAPSKVSAEVVAEFFAEDFPKVVTQAGTKSVGTLTNNET